MNIKGILFILSFLIAGFSVCQGDMSKKSSIKLKKINTNGDFSYKFKSGDYILTFRSNDIFQIATKLNTDFNLSPNDTVDFKGFIAVINSSGKGNSINNYRLNKSFRVLLDKGYVEVYCISRNQKLKKMNKIIDNRMPQAGSIYYYLDQHNSILEFWEASWGCPEF